MNTTAPIEHSRIHTLSAIGVTALLFALTGCEVGTVDTIIISTLLFLIYLLVFKTIETKLSLLEIVSGLAIILGGTCESISVLPERRIMLIAMAAVTGYVFCNQMKKETRSTAWLLLTLGMTTAPYTELFQMRNLWNIGTLGIGLFHNIRQNSFLTQVSRRSQIAVLIWFALGVYSLTSCATSAYPYLTLRFSGIIFFLGLLLILTVSEMSRPEVRQDIVQSILIFVGVYLAAVIEAISYRALNLGLGDALGFRLDVFQHHPNYTIFITLMCLPLWFTCIKPQQNRKNLLIITGLTGSLLYLIFLSYSRQGYLLITVFGLLLIFLTHERSLRRLFAWVVGIGASVLALSLVFSDTLQTRILSIFNLSQSLRFNAWKVFYDLIIENPVTGYGLGTNRYIYPRALAMMRPGEPSTRQFLFEAHNAYVDMATGTGILGLAIFCLFLIWCTLPTSQPRNIEQRVACTIGFGIWFDLFFNFRLHALDTSAFLIVFLAYCLSIQSGNEKLSRTVKVSPMLRTVVVVLILVFCSLPWLSKHQVTQAQSQLKNGDWDVVTKHFKLAALLEPLNAHPQYYIGLCEAQKQNPDATFEAYATAVKLCPNYPIYRYSLATQLIENRQPNEAMKQLEVADYLEPYDPDGRVSFNLGILQQRFGHYEQAESSFIKTVLLNPDYINDPYWQAKPRIRERIVRILQNYITAFYSAGHLTGDRTSRLINSFEALRKVGITQEIERHSKGIAWINPGNIDFLTWTVRYLLSIENLSDAEELLYQGLVRSPDHPILLNYLGYIYMTQNQLKLAEYCVNKSFDNWSEIALDNYFGYQLLYEIADRAGQQARKKELEVKLRFLGNDEYLRQVNALTLHIGKDSHLVNAPVLDGSDVSRKTP